MSEDDKTIKELEKFNFVRDYLIAEKVFDYDSFYELVI
jgi:hypothetical protein